MSAVVVSRFDSVSFLRAAIQADIVRDTSTANTTTINNAGFRQGRRGSGSGSGSGGCPPFAFSYADGVAVDRGQEERLSVKDIAVTSSPAASSTSSTAGEVFLDQRWEEDIASDDSERKELRVFLRACDPRTQQPTADNGAGGVLHRWEDLQGGSWGNEVNERVRASTFLRNGRDRHASISSACSRSRQQWERVVKLGAVSQKKSNKSDHQEYINLP